ncbi:pyridoxal-phosphate dependent enzyme [Sphingomonas adhaesiva]|uniref:pyridoxal-phosphate dependent enzyme n=1 Tax=Sphingomonas adhaesiva TaxID=28212 RepID=UPI002FFAF282
MSDAAADGWYSAGDGDVAFGGQFVAPALLPVLDRLDAAFRAAVADRGFAAELARLLADHVGRPTPLTTARLDADGATVLLKREDLTSSGGSFGDSALGQCLLARRMGFEAVVADTGSGDNGVAIAAAAARLGLAATIYIPDGATRRQALMADRMRASGATVVAIPGDASLLHQAMSGAIQHWMGQADRCFYIAGGPIGPHPYPAIVRHFHHAIGEEVRRHLAERCGRPPAAAVASFDGGGTAMGLFAAFLDTPARLILAEPGEGGGAFANGRPGVLHGAHTLVSQDADGQLPEARPFAPGMVYPAAPPELAAWVRQGRVTAVAVDESAAVRSLRDAATRLGLLISIEAAFALAQARRTAALLPPDATVVAVVNAGGAKDLALFEERA